MSNNDSNTQRVRKPRSGSRAATDTQKLLSLRQAERVYGVPYTSWRDLALRGKIPTVRLPGSKRMWLLRSDVESLIAQSREVAA